MAVKTRRGSNVNDDEKTAVEVEYQGILKDVVTEVCQVSTVDSITCQGHDINDFLCILFSVD